MTLRNGHYCLLLFLELGRRRKKLNIYRRLEKVSKVNPTGKSDSVRLRCVAMRSCVSGCVSEFSPSDFPGAGIFSMQCPPPCRAAARGSPFCAAGRGRVRTSIWRGKSSRLAAPNVAAPPGSGRSRAAGTFRARAPDDFETISRRFQDDR